MKRKGWIKLHRDLLDWEWYSDINVCRVFVHMLLTASYEDKKWKGVLIPRGSLVTSKKNLADEVGLSEQNIRTVLHKLCDAEAITQRSTQNYTVVTILNYNKYQDINQPSTNESTNDQPTTNQQINQRPVATQHDKPTSANQPPFENNSKINQPTNNILRSIKKEEERSIYTPKINSLEKLNENKNLVITELATKFPSKDISKAIEVLTDYCNANGKSYKDYVSALSNWIRNDQRGQFNKPTIKNDIADSSIEYLKSLKARYYGEG